jgi:hypothetical protein
MQGHGDPPRPCSIAIAGFTNLRVRINNLSAHEFKVGLAFLLWPVGSGCATRT